MAFTPKDWRNATASTGGGDESTPLTAAALEDMETRLSGYSDTAITAWASANLPVNVLDFGAVGNGSADDTAEIQAAIDSIAGTGQFGEGGIVFMPPGIYQISAQLSVPDGVRLVGSGRLTQIRATGGFPTTTALIRLGTGSGSCYGTRLEDLSIRCNAIAGSVGVYSSDMQEQSGIRNVRIDQYKSMGIQLEAGASLNYPANFHISDVECAPDDAATNTIGLFYSCTDHTGSGGLVERLTVIASAGAALQTAGVKIVGDASTTTALTINSVSVENHAHGVWVSYNGTATINDASNYVAGTNLVYIDADAAQSVVCTRLRRGVGTNTVKNDLISVNITEASVAFYATSSDDGAVCLDATNGFRALMSVTPSVNSAATITLPHTSDIIRVAGTTNINTAINATYPGHRVTLLFLGSLTLQPANVYMVGGAAFSATASDTFTMICDGTNWYEVARAANS